MGLFGWLVRWLVWMVGGSVGWVGLSLAGWLVDLDGWLFGELVGGLISCLVGVDRLVG